MPLEEVVDTLDGIGENYKDLYVENEDGKFEINIDGLKSALTKERMLRKNLEKNRNKGDDNDPPDIEELKTQLKQKDVMITNMKMNSILKDRAITSGVDPDYVDDVLILTKGNFKLDDEGSVIVVDAGGEPTGKSVDNFFKADFKKSKPRFYTNDGKSGGGMSQNLRNEGPLSYDGKLAKARESGDRKAVLDLKLNKLKT